MERVIIRYRLKDGIEKEKFIKYSINRDQPTVRRQEGVHSFDVYEVIGQDNAQQEYHFFEDLIVESYKKWEEITSNDEMKSNIDEWILYGDSTSVEVIYGRKVE